MSAAAALHSNYAVWGVEWLFLFCEEKHRKILRAGVLGEALAWGIWAGEASSEETQMLELDLPTSTERIPEWFGWKGPESSPSSTPCHGQGHFPLQQVPSSPIYAHLRHFQVLNVWVHTDVTQLRGILRLQLQTS